MQVTVHDAVSGAARVGKVGWVDDDVRVRVFVGIVAKGWKTCEAAASAGRAAGTIAGETSSAVGWSGEGRRRLGVPSVVDACMAAAFLAVGGRRLEALVGLESGPASHTLGDFASPFRWFAYELK